MDLELLGLLKSLGPLGGLIVLFLVGHKVGWWEIRRGNGKKAGDQSIQFWQEEIRRTTEGAIVTSMKPFIEALTLLLNDNKAVQTKIADGTQELVVLARLAWSKRSEG